MSTAAALAASIAHTTNRHKLGCAEADATRPEPWMIRAGIELADKIIVGIEQGKRQ